ncbi:hypothetical protein [Microbacterium paulum]
MRLPRDVYIHAAERVAYAMSLAQDLSLRTSLWWAQDPVTVLARSGSRSSDIEVVALTDPLPPLNDWWRRAVDVLSNVRSALDQFHHEVWINQVGSEPGRSIYFPITANEPSWDKWAREHRRFSPELIERYRAFQPWVSGRPYFETLSEIKRAENHRRSLVPGLDLATLNTGMIESTVAPMLTEAELKELTEITVAESTALDVPERVLLTLSTPGHVELTTDPTILRDYTFAPYFVAGGEHVPWTPGISLITREATWAIAHIAGLEGDAVNPPTHFDFD